MATTFHVVNFKNPTLNMLTGSGSPSATPIGYVNPYNGVQAADPSVAPAGTLSYSSISSAPNLSTRLTSSGGGISQLSSPTAPTTPAGAAAVASLTFARIYTTGQLPIIDVSVSVSGGGGGVILDSLTSTAGTGNIVQAFALKMPTSLGTILLSQSLVDRLVDIWGTTGTAGPYMGVNTSGGCTLNLYSGAAPSTADAPATGTLLATFSMSATNMWAAAAGGAAALNGAGPSVVASGTGTAGYFRMVKTNGTSTFTMQGTVGVTSGASDMILNTVTLTSGVTSVQVTDATITL